MQTCTRCLLIKPIDEFYSRSATRKHRQCQSCLRELAKERGRNNPSYLMKRYGLSEREFLDMVARQKGVCAICSKPDDLGTRLSVRGLLCRRCNTAIGLLYDDRAMLLKAADYLLGEPNVKLPPTWAEALAMVQEIMPDAVIAGGALRDLICGKAIKDLDIFGSPSLADQNLTRYWMEKRFKARAKIVISEFYANYTKSIDGVRFAIEIDADNLTGLPVQVIAMKEPVTMLSACERIDFGLCRVAWDGHELFQSTAFHEDRVKGTFTLLRAHTSDQVERSIHRFNRLRDKYPEFRLVVP